MQIIAFLISFYIFGSLLTTFTDLVALKSTQASTSKPSQPVNHGGTTRR